VHRLYHFAPLKPARNIRLVGSNDQQKASFINRP
jgi:hypothetical protein